MNSEKIYRLLAIELTVILPSEIVCMRQNLDSVFNYVILGVFALDGILALIWFLRKKNKERKKQRKKGKECQ